MNKLLSRPATLGLIASAVIIAVWYQLLWSHQGQAIASAHRRQREATGALISAQQRLGHLKKIASRAPALTALDQKLSNAIPDRDAIDQFIIGLTAEAQASNVTIASYGLTAPGKGSTAAAPGVQVVSLQMQARGGYFALQRLLGMLRDESRLLVIDQVALTPLGKPGAGLGDGTPLQATIVGHLFVASTGAPALTFTAPGALGLTKPGTGVVETPINAARSAVAGANAAQAGGAP